MKRKAVFFDRDGTIIEDMDYLSDPNGVRLIKGAAYAIRILSEAGYFIVMVSNQSGVARGMFTIYEVQLVNERVEVELEKAGSRLDAVYFCPHYDKGSVPAYSFSCACRKPRPGMGLRAAQEHELLLSESYMIGDKYSDVEFARNCGMKNGILVRTGHGMEQTLLLSDYGMEAADIYAAAKMIIKQGDCI